MLFMRKTPPSPITSGWLLAAPVPRVYAAALAVSNVMFATLTSPVRSIVVRLLPLLLKVAVSAPLG